MDRKHYKGGGVVSQRLHINCFNIVFSCAFLIIANSVARGHFTERINKISNDLNRSLGAVFDTPVTNYTSIYENVTYVSSISFNSRGMAVLYNVTTKFMDLIASKEIYPEGLIKVEDGNLKLGSVEEQWQSILAHYGALLAIAILLLLFAIIMPVCGFFFCCCRCCGKCGARSKPFDKKGDLCKKICLSSLLICIGTLLLFGVVCAFVTNQALQDHSYELTSTLKNGVKDTDSYLAYTGRQINVLLNVNYGEFENPLFRTLDKCSDIVSEQLEQYSNATSLSEVIGIVDGLNSVKDDLVFIREATTVLRTNASQLNDGLRKVKGELLNVLKDCNAIPDCSKLSNDYIGKLESKIDFDQIPDIGKQLSELESVIGTNLNETIRKGEQELAKIKREINGTVSTELPKVKDAIRKVGTDIVKYSENVTSVITKARNSLHKYVDSPVAEVDKYIKDYTPYRYYLGIAISCILLLVSLCITLGLICGICGKRPDAYGDDCCNKGAGSRFLMLGVAIMFLFAIVLAVVAIVYFVSGVLAQRLACDSLRKPEDSQVLRLADQVINFKQSIGIDTNLSSVLIAIHKNKTIYYTFELKQYFDLDQIDQYIEKFEIKKMLDNLKSKINPNTNIELIKDETKDKMNELINSSKSIKYDKFFDELKTNFTTHNLNFLSEQLDQLVQTIMIRYPKHRDIATSLRLSSLHLRTYQANLVDPMTVKVNEVIGKVKHVESSFNSTLIENLLHELQVAQDYLKHNGTAAMGEIAESFAMGLEKQVRSYLDRVTTNTKDHLGSSAPISHIINATLIATCDKILLPWNGFWFSILWCLILFVPAIILSVKLAGLYQKYEAYPGPLVEAEYLYDAYAERDNIPLSSSRNDKPYKRKKKHKKVDRRGDYMAEPANDRAAAREVPSGSARYADMAPKHWDEFPAGGPPHYQRAPTEYERPPPYYYPSTEQQQ